MAYKGKVHEINPRDLCTPLCGKPGGLTRAGRPHLKVQCKNCLRLMASRKIIARRIAARRAQRQQRQRGREM